MSYLPRLNILSLRLHLPPIIIMTKLGAWFRAHLVFRPVREKQSMDQPPFFTSTRRPITPTSFDTATCLFFRLPYDIRSIILTMAFGERVLHMDIAHEEETWRWKGTVCNRNGPRQLPSMRYAWLGPWNDNCMQQMENHKRNWSTRPHAYRTGPEVWCIGIMGFLLSCRQAYAEGIDVLFSDNYISIQSQFLLSHLPKLIPHNRLASITSLEIVIEARCVEQENRRPSYNLDHLELILDNIVKHCGHLRRFCLSFAIREFYGHAHLEGPALPLADAFCKATQLRIMKVELPERDYWPAWDYQLQPKHDHPREEPSKSRKDRSLWRSLDSEKPVVHKRALDRYPYPPLKLPVTHGDDTRESQGYWLCQGDVGPGLPMRPCYVP
jgi:hypothetical protein